MKILFSNTFYQERVEYTSLISVIPPLDLAYCAALVRERIPQAVVSILDANVLRLSLEEQAKSIKDSMPEFIVFTAATHSINAVKRLCQELQSEKVTKILIGTHGSALPKEALEWIPEIDIVAYGEPEITVLEIIQSIIGNKPLSLVRGIYYRINNLVVNTEPRPVLEDLDSLSFPARDLLPNKHYFSPYSRSVTALQTTRGCPGQCTFCDSHLINGRSYRQRNPNRVVEEMEECFRKFGIRYFAIIDHTFTVSSAFVEQICFSVIKNGLRGKISWACNTRADMLSSQMILLMKRAGCIQIGIGIESGCNTKLALLQKGITEEQIKEAILRIKRCGIIAFGYAIIGFPGDTMESINQTKNKIFDFNPHTLQLSFATPLPGSELYEYCKKSNLISSDNWDDFVFLRKSIIVNQEFTCKELSILRKSIIKQFYFRPAKLLELFYLFTVKIHPDYLNSIKAFLKIIVNMEK
jgi:anaerobic magnesium-protoporphyrin IX monomethyl ester cyclase